MKKKEKFITVQRQLEFKDIYTRAVLLKYAATMVSEVDAHTIEAYLEANSKSVPMRELANSVIRSRMQNLLRQTTTKPTEQMLPLNPTNRQHQLFHKLAVEEKTLPKIFRNHPAPQKRQNNQFKVKKTFKKQNQKFQFQQQPQQNQRKPGTPSKKFQGAARPRVTKQNFQTSRSGPSNSSSHPNGNCKSKKAKNPTEAVQQLRNAYDIRKIADKLEHFGNTTPEVQLMLQHQLVQRSLDVAPNPKKPSVTPNNLET